MHLKMLSTKWQPFCVGLNILKMAKGKPTSRHVVRSLLLKMCSRSIFCSRSFISRLLIKLYASMFFLLVNTCIYFYFLQLDKTKNTQFHLSSVKLFHKSQFHLPSVISFYVSHTIIFIYLPSNYFMLCLRAKWMRFDLLVSFCIFANEIESKKSK